MPVLDVVRATIERSLNFAIKADPESTSRLKRVAGKVFRLTVKELPEPVTILFYDNGIALMGPAYDCIDCELRLSMANLTVLSDAALVTEAIRQGDIELQGDPAMAQQAAAVFTGLDIDWEDLLAGYAGDVPGYLLSQGIQKLRALIPASGAFYGRASEFLTDESQVLATPLHFKLLQDDVAELDKDINRLEEAINRLENG